MNDDFQLEGDGPHSTNLSFTEYNPETRISTTIESAYVLINNSRNRNPNIIPWKKKKGECGGGKGRLKKRKVKTIKLEHIIMEQKKTT